MMESLTEDLIRGREMNNTGFFKVSPSSKKTVLKLKGNFDESNIIWVKSAIQVSNQHNGNNKKCLEINLEEVENINMQAMALLVIALKTLNEKGVHTRVTGLEGPALELANALGMHYITPIN